MQPEPPARKDQKVIPELQALKGPKACKVKLERQVHRARKVNKVHKDYKASRVKPAPKDHKVSLELGCQLVDLQVKSLQKIVA